MSVIYGYDSFKSGTTIADILSARWTSTGSQFSSMSFNSTAGRFGGQSLRFVLSGFGGWANYRKSGLSNNATMCLHFPFTTSAITNNQRYMLANFFDGTTEQLSLCVNTSGTLSVVRGDATGTVLATSAFVLSPSTYYVVEFKATFATGTGGSIEVRINQTAIIGPTSSLNTSASTNAYANGYGVGHSSAHTLNNPATSAGNINIDYEHVVCLDDFVGDKRFYVDLPNGASSTAWTPNASTNLSRIQEAQQDGDSTYNSSSNPGDIDYFSYAAMAAGVTGIVAVITSIWARKDDAGTRSVRNKIKQSSTAANGATINVSSSYQELIDTFYTDPVSGIAFVKSDVDSLVTGYEEVA